MNCQEKLINITILWLQASKLALTTGIQYQNRLIQHNDEPEYREKWKAVAQSRIDAMDEAITALRQGINAIRTHQPNVPANNFDFWMIYNYLKQAILNELGE